MLPFSTEDAPFPDNCSSKAKLLFFKSVVHGMRTFLCENIRSTRFVRATTSFGSAPHCGAISTFHIHPEPLKKSDWLGYHSKKGKMKRSRAGLRINSNIAIVSKYSVIAIVIFWYQ